MWHNSKILMFIRCYLVLFTNFGELWNQKLQETCICFSDVNRLVLIWWFKVWDLGTFQKVCGLPSFVYHCWVWGNVWTRFLSRREISAVSVTVTAGFQIEKTCAQMPLEFLSRILGCKEQWQEQVNFLIWTWLKNMDTPRPWVVPKNCNVGWFWGPIS